MYQLIGELILEAEQKGDYLFEDGSSLECMEVDSGYEYDDGCCMFSRFGLNLQSTTGQSLTINDWCDDSEAHVASVLAFKITVGISLEKTLCKQLFPLATIDSPGPSRISTEKVLKSPV